MPPLRVPQCPGAAEFAPEFRVHQGSKLIGISRRTGWYVDAVQFHFSDGSYRGEIRGLSGNAGDLVEVLGLIFWPAE